MQQIEDWLIKLGMSEYSQRFAENGIGFTALHHLTDQDLKDIGVLLGHRRIMLAAIQELGRTATTQPATVEPKPQDTAERRQVTVMFSDLVSSTALAARMDPEDLRELISAYQKCVAETVSRFGGFVAKYMGDGVLVYFGYPRAHEDDAERAVGRDWRSSRRSVRRTVFVLIPTGALNVFAAVLRHYCRWHRKSTTRNENSMSRESVKLRVLLSLVVALLVSSIAVGGPIVSMPGPVDIEGTQSLSCGSFPRPTRACSCAPRCSGHAAKAHFRWW
jgi:hypothetical protein